MSQGSSLRVGASVWLEERARRNLGEDAFGRVRPVVEKGVTQMALIAPSAAITDLSAWAWKGVLEAHERGRGELDDTELGAYALYRVQSALLDAVASQDEEEESIREMSSRLACVIRCLVRELGRSPSAREIAESLGLTQAEYARDLLRLAEHGRPMLEAVYEPPTIASSMLPDADPGTRADVRSALDRALDGLPEPERNLLSLHYEDGLSLDQIASLAEVDLLSIRQMHAEAMHRLRAAMEDQ